MGSTSPPAPEHLHLFKPTGVPTLPLWINGHAVLSPGKTLHAVRDRRTGATRCQIPMCGDVEIAEALDAARAAAHLWRQSRLEERMRVPAAVSQKLSGSLYAEHFAKLLTAESGLDEAAARIEVEELKQALAAMGNAPTGSDKDEGGQDKILCVIVHPAPQESFFACAKRLALLLLDGRGTITVPRVDAPSALLALVELYSRCGLPAGLASILYGKEPFVVQLRTAMMSDQTESQDNQQG